MSGSELIAMWREQAGSYRRAAAIRRQKHSVKDSIAEMFDVKADTLLACARELEAVCSDPVHKNQ